FDFSARLRFEPSLGKLAVERVLAIAGVRRTCARKLFGETRDFGGVMLARRCALIQSEAQLAVGDLGKFDAAYAQAHAAIVPGDVFDVRQRGNALPGTCGVRRGPAARFQARIDIAVVVRLGADEIVLLVVGEELDAGGARVQAEDAQRGGAFLAGGDVGCEALYCGARFAAAPVSEPDPTQ